jgi:hypothetical protein
MRMKRWRRIVAKLLTLLRTKRVESELAREVASHLILLEDEFQRRGMTPDEAHGAAGLWRR